MSRLVKRKMEYPPVRKAPAVFLSLIFIDIQFFPKL